PFDERTYRVAIAPDEPINDLARRLAAYGGGGTNCALPLEYVNTHFSHRAYAGCVLVSDNESWVGCGRYGATGVMDAWRTFVGHQARNHPAEFDGPKLVCLDLAPGATTQAAEASDVLNVGGFSDAVFGIIADFINGEDARFVAEIEAIEL
ncbi:MAG TPA: TROVE domain-containing protein, partial [Pirellulales bacterium]